MARDGESGASSDGVERLGRSMGRSSMFVVLSVLVILLVRYESDVFFSILAGLFFSIFLRYPSEWISRRTGLPRLMALLLVVVVLVATLALCTWLLGAQLGDQFQALFEQLPKALLALRRSLGRLPLVHALVGSSLDTSGAQVTTKEIVAGATSVVSRVMAVLVGLTAMFFIGIYGAAQPETYGRMLVRLVPPKRRGRAVEVMRDIHHNLTRWLVGRIIAMLSVAVLTGIGLLIVGIPLAVPLGIVAGLFTFVEYLGAVVSAVPAVVIALEESPSNGLWVVLVFALAHLVEGYLLTPFITKGTVRFPPAFTLGAQLLFGSLFGVVGLTFATPVAVIIVMLVQKLYVEDVLGDPAH